MQKSKSDLELKSINSVKWQGSAEVVIRILQFLTTIVLARILIPEDFGIINIAFIFTQFAFVMFDFGFSSALIQKENIKDDHYKSVFSIFTISSVVFYCIINIFSEYIASWFQISEHTRVLNVIILIIFAYALNAIPQVILMRQMRFKELSHFQLISSLTYSITAILLALNNFGVYSFVYAVLAEQYLLAILLIVRTKWWPKLGWDRTAIREIAGFGGNVLGTRIMGYVNKNLPNIVIGKFLGTHWLGLYSVAYQFVDFPVQRIAKMILKVMFPAFSQLQNQLDEFRRLFQKVLYHLELILFPMFIGMAIVAGPLFHVMYGNKWNDAILPFQILIGLGIVRSLWTINSLVFLSMGKPQIELKINIIMVTVLLPSLIITSQINLIYCCIMIVFVTAIFGGVGMLKGTQMIKFPVHEYLKTGLIPTIGSLVMLGITLILKFFINGEINHLKHLIILIGVNFLVYSLVLYIMDKSIFKKIPRFFAA